MRVRMFFLLFLFGFGGRAWAEGTITREYWLKNTDASTMIRVLTIAVRDPDKRRIMGGQGNHLVVTDFQDQQLEIADLVPIFDQQTGETNPDRIVMVMLTRGARYLKEKKKMFVAQKGGASSDIRPGSSSASPSSGVNSFSLYKTTYSIYDQEDAQLMKKRRVIESEGNLPPLGSLILKGIFQSANGTPLALLSFENSNFVARDGGLFERNRTRVQDVVSHVSKDKVILTGPDRIPREYRFKSSL